MTRFVKKILIKLIYTPREDFGASRVACIIFLSNGFLFLVCLALGKLIPELLVPVLVSLIIQLSIPIWSKFSTLSKFLINCFHVSFMGVANYILVSKIDLAFGGLSRQDKYFYAFDNYFLDKPLALLIQEGLAPFKLISVIFYDTVMVSYILYFFMPFFCAGILYRKLPEDKKYVLGEYALIIACYYILNFFFYLIVPVTGPQFYLKDSFKKELPFSPFGQMLYELVQAGQTTFIDCFPSGHFGICFLVTLILYRLNDYRYCFTGLICLGVGGATIALRYHYFLDLVGAIILAIFCIWVGAKLYPTKFHIKDLRED